MILKGEPALSIESLSVAVKPASLLRFWPQFTEFAMEKPALEIVSLDNNQLQIAGIKLSSSSDGPNNPERLLSWMLDQRSGAWAQRRDNLAAPGGGQSPL